MEAQEQIGELLAEFKEHRNEIKKMIEELDKIKDKVDTLLPTTLDQRYARLFEEKVKAMTGLFGALLEMRKEIGKSLKDEIEIRRKLDVKGDLDDIIEDELDIRRLAGKVEDFKVTRKKIRDKVEQAAKDEPAIEEIEIPGVTSELIT